MGILCFEVLSGRVGAILDFDDGGSQVAFGLARGFNFLAQVPELEFTLVKQPRLLSEAGFEILRAAAEDFRLLGLRHQLLLKVADAPGRILDPAALLQKPLRRRFQFYALSIPAVLDGLQLMAGSIQPFFQGIDLSLERDDLNLLGIGESVDPLVQFTHHLGEFRLLARDKARWASYIALLLTATSSSVACNWSRRLLSRASSAKIVAIFSPSSTLRRLMASPFFPSSANWLVLLVLSCSTLISRRRVDMANSARS